MVWILRWCCHVMSKNLCHIIDKIKNHELGLVVFVDWFCDRAKRKGGGQVGCAEVRATRAL